MPDDDDEIPPQPESGGFGGMGEDDIGQMADESLIHWHAKLHTPALKPSHWIAKLEAEMHRRGLIRPS